MTRKRRDAASTTATWGDLRPRRLLPHEQRDELDGRPVVSVLVPRLYSRPMRALLERLRITPRRVHLDEVGSFVWMRCDGEHTVAEIGDALRQAFGERVEPVEDRLTLFFRQMQRAEMVALETPAAAA